jgi:hypothetical protein
MNHWSETETNTLRDLLYSGKSKSEIAVFLQRTKNSVIGHIYRLGLNKGRPDHQHSTIQFHGITPKLPAPVSKDYIKPSTFIVFEHCQFIHGEGKHRQFCVDPIHKGTYCEQHDRICYVRAK